MMKKAMRNDLGVDKETQKALENVQDYHVTPKKRYSNQTFSESFYQALKRVDERDYQIPQTIVMYIPVDYLDEDKAGAREFLSKILKVGKDERFGMEVSPTSSQLENNPKKYLTEFDSLEENADGKPVKKTAYIISCVYVQGETNVSALKKYFIDNQNYRKEHPEMPEEEYTWSSYRIPDGFFENFPGRLTEQ